MGSFGTSTQAVGAQQAALRILGVVGHPCDDGHARVASLTCFACLTAATADDAMPQ
jgi:hypothetical protein